MLFTFWAPLLKLSYLNLYKIYDIWLLINRMNIKLNDIYCSYD